MFVFSFFEGNKPLDWGFEPIGTAGFSYFLERKQLAKLSGVSPCAHCGAKLAPQRKVRLKRFQIVFTAEDPVKGRSAGAKLSLRT